MAPPSDVVPAIDVPPMPAIDVPPKLKPPTLEPPLPILPAAPPLPELS
jgi:hypothetical protein